MSALARIQWIHKKIAAGCYPNSSHMTERFGISQRQAQRDFDMLKKVYGAPLMYSTERRGYYYTESFFMPTMDEESDETDYIDIVSGVEDAYRSSGEETQLRMPYSATLEIKDKLTVMNLRRFIIGRDGKDTYNCEFFNVDSFLGILFTSGADIKVVSPDWLRRKLVSDAARILKNNGD